MLGVQHYPERQTSAPLPEAKETNLHGILTEGMDMGKYILANEKDKQRSFMEMVDINSVELGGEHFRNEQANKLDNYLKKWSDKYKNTKGVLTIKDKTEMLKDKRLLEAWQSENAGIYKDYKTSKMTIAQNPDLFDIEESNKVFKDYEEKGIIPREGFYKYAKIDTRSLLADLSKKYSEIKSLTFEKLTIEDGKINTNTTKTGTLTDEEKEKWNLFEETYNSNLLFRNTYNRDFNELSNAEKEQAIQNYDSNLTLSKGGTGTRVANSKEVEGAIKKWGYEKDKNVIQFEHKVHTEDLPPVGGGKDKEPVELNPQEITYTDAGGVERKRYGYVFPDIPVKLTGFMNIPEVNVVGVYVDTDSFKDETGNKVPSGQTGYMAEISIPVDEEVNKEDILKKFSTPAMADIFLIANKGKFQNSEQKSNLHTGTWLVPYDWVKGPLGRNFKFNGMLTQDELDEIIDSGGTIQ